MIDPPASERQLVDAILGGDSEGFRVLVERESRSVIGICSRILGDRAEAEDIAQDAFLGAYRALATFRGDGPFGAWVGRIAARLAVARLVARREVLPLDADGAERWTAALQSSDDPEAHALDLERRRSIQAAMAALPASQRDVVALRFYADLSLDEIAELTSRPVGTVKSRLHRGIASLREQLSSRSAT